MLENVTSGYMLKNYKCQMARIVDKQATGMIAMLAAFEVMEVGPLIDLGHGWKKRSEGL